MAVCAATARSVTTRCAILANNPSQRTVRLAVNTNCFAPDILSMACELSKIAIKDAMQKGSVWLKRPGCKEQRIRKARFQLQAGDTISLFYDAQVLAKTPPLPQLVAREKNYSIWNKPAGLLTQGTRFGDHCSLLRYVEKEVDFCRTAKLVHRLDREAQGLVVLAHNQRAAAALSSLFQSREIEKRYWGVARGRVGEIGDRLVCDTALDGKEAVTVVTVKDIAGEYDVSILDILLQTGRKHQIRRHLSMLGHPLVGDTRYGHARESEDLLLCACFLAFICPLTGKNRRYSITPPSFPRQAVEA